MKNQCSVTVVADVASKKESAYDIGVVVAIGSFKQRVPRNIKNKKLPAINRGGEILMLFFLKLRIQTLPIFKNPK